MREFFSLSPRWLQAGAVAATLMVCALTALTIARTEIRWDANGIAFRTGVNERVIVKEAPVPNGFSQAEVANIVNREIEDARKQWQSEIDSTQPVIKASDSSEKSPRPELASTPSPRTPRRKRTVPPPSQRQDLVMRTDDDELPRLSDLLGGVY